MVDCNFEQTQESSAVEPSFSDHLSEIFGPGSSCDSANSASTAQSVQDVQQPPASTSTGNQESENGESRGFSVMTDYDDWRWPGPTTKYHNQIRGVKSSEQSRKDHLDARFSRDLTDADNTQIDQLTTNFGKDLNSRDREQLRNVLSTLLSGKVSKFEEFVPLGEKQMSQNVQRAFTAAMKSVGVIAEFSKNGYECLAGDFAPDSNRVIETGQSGEIRLKQQGKNSGVTSFECNVDDKPRPLTLGPRSSVRRYYDTHNWTSGPGKPPLSNIIDTIRSRQERNVR